MAGDGLEEAAQAFDKAMQVDSGPAPAQSRAPAGGKQDVTEGPTDRLFPNVGELEVDEESPARGGGDDDDVSGDEDVSPRAPEEVEEGDETDEDETPEADEEGDGEEGVDDQFLAQEVEVVVDGEEQKVTLKEALEGYVRTKTFHKRMNEVEEAKQIIARTAADAVQNYEYSVQVAQQIQAHLEALVPAEPNWDEEFKKNPVAAREKQKYYDQVKGFRAELDKKLGEAAAKMQESNAVQLSAFATAEARKFDSLNAKSWAADPKKKSKDLNSMRRTALSHGFSEEEIAQVYDSRMLMVLLKASRYDRMMASRPKPIRRVTNGKQLPPGGGSARSKVSDRGVSSAVKRLNKTGHIEDAALVFDNILKSERPARR